MGGGLTAALEGLTDRDWQVRVRSVRYLGDQRVGAASARVVALLRDPNGQVRDAALRALVQIGEPAVPVLIGMLRVEQDQKLIRTIILGLQRIGGAALPYLLPELSDDVTEFVTSIIRVLGGIRHEDAIRVLIDLVAVQNPRSHYPAMDALRNQRETAAPALIQALQDADRHRRRYAAELLGELVYTPASPALIPLVNDPEFMVQRVVFNTLARLRHPEGIAAVVGQAHQHADEQVRGQALIALDRLPLADLLPIMQEAIQHDPSLHVRRCAMGVLLRYPMSLLSRSDEEVEQNDEVLEADLIPMMLSVVMDDQQVRSIRESAVQFLERSSEPHLVFIAQNDRLPEALRLAALDGLCSRGWLTTLALAEISQDASDTMRERASSYLQELNDYPYSAEAYAQVLTTGMILGPSQALAIESLRCLADPATVPALIEGLNLTALVWYYPFDGHGEGNLERVTIGEIAARALTKIGTPEALAAVDRWRSG